MYTKNSTTTRRGAASRDDARGTIARSKRKRRFESF